MFPPKDSVVLFHQRFYQGVPHPGADGFSAHACDQLRYGMRADQVVQYRLFRMLGQKRSRHQRRNHVSADLFAKAIDQKHPVGICGSGLLDSLAELFTKGIIDRTGRFKDIGQPRLTEGDEGRQFQISPSDNEHQEIVITQADIDNLIRSKAGVFASIKILMESTQTTSEDLEAVYLAGGFGNFLNIQQAVNIGMLPDVPLEKMRFVGNTSIAGAKTVLLSRQALETAEKIAESMTYFDLMSHPGYMDEFTRANFLPHTDLSLFPTVSEVKCET